MDIQGYFTAKGLALSAKLLSGKTLEITRVTAGSGHTDKPTSATTLPQTQQALAVNTPTHSGSTAVIPATLVAAQARTSYTLTELGVYAKDPDEGEILYKIYQLSDAVDIVAGSRTVLRFYLEETVSQDLNMTVVCSPAGLITEEDFFPVRDRVTAVKAVTKTYTMDIGNVQAFLDGLPRLLTENLTLYVSGTLAETLTIKGFSGCGRLRIQATESGSCTLAGGVQIEQCAVPLRFVYLNFTEPAESTDSCVSIGDALCVTLESCTLSGSKVRTAIGASGNTEVMVDKSTLTGFDTAVLACRGAKVCVNCTNSGDFSNNRYGAYVWYGGIVLLGGATPELLGGTSHRHAGGIIAKVDGTLI